MNMPEYKNRPNLPPDTHPELPVDPDIVLPRVRRPVHLVGEFQLTVFAGGCLGALSRYGLTLLYPAKDGSWPAATFLVNLLGAFILGLLLEGLARRGDDTGARRFVRLGIGTGFLGAFTTYSTLAVDANLLVKNGHVPLAAAYTFASVAAGLLLSALGIQIAAAHHRRQKERNP
jgi:CrcB protein